MKRIENMNFEELVEIGYCVELTECQIAEAKDKLGTLAPFEPRKTDEEQAAINDANERRMRGI